MPRRRPLVLSSLSFLLLTMVPSFAPAQTWRPHPAEGARYLIIAPDALGDAVIPLAEWKQKKGMQAHITTISEIGAPDQNLIRAYIANAYDTWPVRPEYVVLVGDPDSTAGNPTPIPLPEMGAGTWSDNFYTNVEGDFHNEILPGRIPGDDPSTISTVVNKILGYERHPYVADSLWFRKGTTIVREDGDRTSDSIYWSDARATLETWRQAGYVQEDSFSYFRLDDSTDIVNALSDGRAYVLFRGTSTCTWWPPFTVDPQSTAPGFKLPIIASLTCQQINPYDGTCGERWVKAGTPTEPRGAVGFCGPARMINDHPEWRSAITQGFFQGLFAGDSLCTFGQACEAGRRNVYNLYGNVDEYNGLICIGDPELNLYTTPPKALQVSYSPVVQVGPRLLTVGVTQDGVPFPQALVCVSAATDTTLYAYGYTDSSGQILLSVHPTEPDSLYVTVTGRNSIPHEGHSLVIPPGPCVAYEGHSLNDSLGGNGDGLVNPGETIRMTVTARNWGDSTATQVQAVLRTVDLWVTLADSTQDFGDIPPDSESRSAEPYVFTVSPACTTGHVLSFSLHLWDHDGHTWDGTFMVTVAAPTGIGAEEESPTSPLPRHLLLENRPNPFRSSTAIRFALAESAATTLRIYNLAGELVRTLAEGLRGAGAHQVLWDGCASGGRPVTTGIYFCRLQGGRSVQTKRMVVIRGRS